MSILSRRIVLSFLAVGPAIVGPCVIAKGDQPLTPTGSVELVQGDFEFTEGPAYDAASGKLFFSDIPANKIYTIDAEGKLGTYTADSYHTNGIVAGGPGKFAGKLVACQMDGQLVAYDPNGGKAEVLAKGYEGKRFNAPNDLVVDRDGGVYFTDPLFRAPEPLPQGIQAVYYRAADGTVSRVTGAIAAPNGVALSPDGKSLYVIPSMQAEMLVYPVTGPGKLGEGKTFCTLKQPEGKSGTGGDGMVVDVEGNLYITSQLGVQIFSPSGEYRGVVTTPEVPANVTFGGEDRKTMYITARKGLYRVAMPIAGLAPN
jgi:gluconolactonase